MLDAPAVARWLQAVARRDARRTVSAAPFQLHVHGNEPDLSDVLTTVVPPLSPDLAAAIDRLQACAGDLAPAPLRVEHVVETAPGLSLQLTRAGFRLAALREVMMCSTESPAVQPGLIDVEELDAHSELDRVQVNLWVNERGFDSFAAPPTVADAAAFRSGLLDARAFTAHVAGHVAAAGMYSEPLDNVVEFAGIATLVEHRGRGVATALAAHMLWAARRRGIAAAVLTTDNPAAIRAYQRAGFETVGRLAVHRLP